MEQLLHLDKELFVFLNGLGSKPFDQFWLIITKQLNWTPCFVVLLVILQKKIGWKNLGIVLLFIAVLITFTDQVTNLFKNGIRRLRPCNTVDILDVIRVVKHSDTFSFFSGHAANSTASMMFIFLLLRNYYKYAFVVFAFPLIFAYSRIYLGLHFPLDILSGYAFGMLSGLFFYKLYEVFMRKYSKYSVDF